MNKSESKYFNTARLMNEALLLLLDKKSYEYITVKELCEKAGVNRSTFYLHYESMNDLLAESIDYKIKRMKECFQEEHKINKRLIEECSLDELKLVTPQYLVPYLNFVKENKLLYSIVAMQPDLFKSDAIFEDMYDELFNPIMNRFHFSDSEKKYYMAFYLNGMYAVILMWVKNNCTEKVEDIAKLLMKCVDS